MRWRRCCPAWVSRPSRSTPNASTWCRGRAPVNRRLTHFLVSIVGAALIVATWAFSLVATRSGRAGVEKPAFRSVIPLIAHPVNDSLVSCVHCHVSGPGGTPRSHATYVVATCLTCHKVAPVGTLMHRGPATDHASVAGPIPHVLVAPFENCVACHAIGGNLSMPGNHSGYTNGDCTS